MTDREWEQWHYDLWCEQRLYRLSKNWRQETYRAQIQYLGRFNEELVAQVDELQSDLAFERQLLGDVLAEFKEFREWRAMQRMAA